MNTKGGWGEGGRGRGPGVIEKPSLISLHGMMVWWASLDQADQVQKVSIQARNLECTPSLFDLALL